VLAAIPSDPISDMHRRHPTSDWRPNHEEDAPQSVSRVARNFNLLCVKAYNVKHANKRIDMADTNFIDYWIPALSLYINKLI